MTGSVSFRHSSDSGAFQPPPSSRARRAGRPQARIPPDRDAASSKVADEHDQLMLDHVQGEAALARLVQRRDQRQASGPPSRRRTATASGPGCSTGAASRARPMRKIARISASGTMTHGSKVQPTGSLADAMGRGRRRRRERQRDGEHEAGSLEAWRDHHCGDDRQDHREARTARHDPTEMTAITFPRRRFGFFARTRATTRKPADHRRGDRQQRDDDQRDAELTARQSSNMPSEPN